jgi:hypothetical protein
VRDARVQVDLVGLAALPQNLLAAVALLDREDGVGLGGRDGQRALEAAQLVLLDERGVREEADVDPVLEVACDILRKKKKKKKGCEPS